MRESLLEAQRAERQSLATAVSQSGPAVASTTSTAGSGSTTAEVADGMHT
jgi:hypothetical protein